MRQQREHLQKELELMAAAGGGGGQGGQNAVATMEQTRAIKQQQAMMETLMTQMQEIKSQGALGGGAPVSASSRVIEKEVADPKVLADNEKLKKQVSTLKEQLASASSACWWKTVAMSAACLGRHYVLVAFASKLVSRVQKI